MVICMFNIFVSLNPLLQSFLAGLFTFFVTVLGSSVVFLFKNIKADIMDGMLASAAGIMLAATFFSLLNPAIEYANNIFNNGWIIVTIGFIVGNIFLLIGNCLLDKCCLKKDNFSLKRCIILFISITLHNIPEGLVLGVAFGSYYYGKSSIISALILTAGIALQNFPEGSAISLPLRRDGLSLNKSFLFGALSGFVEPIFAVIGALLVLKIKLILPFILSFAAGAMFFVIVIELIPESQKNKKAGLMTLLNMTAFSLMMLLELLLG